MRLPSARQVASSPAEQELLEGLRRGDLEARTLAVRRWHAPLRRHAFRVLRDEALAEDAVQDSWMVAFSSLERFDRRCSLFHWFASIVLNVARDRARRERRHAPLGELPALADEPAGSGPDAAEWLIADVTPERHLLAREGLALVERALQTIPESQRSVIVLRDVWGASAEEACRALSITDPAQRVRLCRARERLRRALEAEQRAAA